MVRAANGEVHPTRCSLLEDKDKDHSTKHNRREVEDHLGEAHSVERLDTIQDKVDCIGLT